MPLNSSMVAILSERRCIIFTVVHFDDWVGDYQPEYFAQMDAHLLRNPVESAELVFCAGSYLFERTFTMRSATILSEERFTAIGQRFTGRKALCPPE